MGGGWGWGGGGRAAGAGRWGHALGGSIFSFSFLFNLSLPLPPPIGHASQKKKDHFVGTFATSFPELLPPPGTAWPPPVVAAGATPADAAARPEDGGGCVDVAVEAGPAGRRSRLTFRMQRGAGGRRVGAWLTAAVIREDG